MWKVKRTNCDQRRMGDWEADSLILILHASYVNTPRRDVSQGRTILGCGGESVLRTGGNLADRTL
jgi:hypothetical protein